MLLANPLSHVSGASTYVWLHVPSTRQLNSVKVRQQHHLIWLLGTFDTDGEVAPGSQEPRCSSVNKGRSRYFFCWLTFINRMSKGFLDFAIGITFDDADVVSMCGGNDEKSWGWSLADVVSTWHMNNRNRSNAVLAVRDHSFCCRASSPNAMVGIVQGWSTVSAAYPTATVIRGDKRSGSDPYGASFPLE